MVPFRLAGSASPSSDLIIIVIGILEDSSRSYTCTSTFHDECVGVIAVCIKMDMVAVLLRGTAGEPT